MLLLEKIILYFKSYGKQLREALFAFEHIFTQNEASRNAIKNH